MVNFTVESRHAHACNSLAFEAMHGGALEFAVGVALFDVFAFVELDFAFADREGDFHFAVFPIEGEGKESVAFHGGVAEEFANFGFVKEEFARRFWIVV